mgnify:CR=1 FL=1
MKDFKKLSFYEEAETTTSTNTEIASNFCVKRSFAIRKVRVTKARFEKNGYGITVTDLSDHWKYLRMMSIQLFFKTGLAILYELHEKQEQNCA